MRRTRRTAVAAFATLVATTAVTGMAPGTAHATTRLQAESGSYGGACGTEGQTESSHGTASGATVVFLGSRGCDIGFSTGSQASAATVRWYGGGIAGSICGVFKIMAGGVERSRTAQTCSTGGSVDDFRVASFPSNTIPAGSFTLEWDPVTSWHDAHVDWLEINVTSTVTPPSPPQNPYVQTVGGGVVQLDWGIPANTGGSPVTAYRVYGGRDPWAALPFVAEVPASQRWYTHFVEPGWHYYRVSAVNSAGESTQSALVSVKAYALYTVELRAYIPHWKIVDPMLPANPETESGYGYAYAHYIGGGSCNRSASNLSTVWSWYGGDNHTLFPGSYRVRGVLEFKWDGDSLHDAYSPSTSNYGVTRRYRRYQDGVLREECELANATATSSVNTYAMSSTSFRIDYSSENPMTPAWATPAIDGWVEGSFQGGNLSLRYASDDFPTHALRVTRNHNIQLTSYIRDVSCLSQNQVMGSDGRDRVFWGLNTMMPEGSTTVYPGDSGRNERTWSGTC